jgi:hypothetical protein
MFRIAKQFLYGTFYLLILGGLAWGIYSITLKSAPSCFDGRQNGDETGIDCGGPCISCDIKNLKPLIVSPVIQFSSDRLYSVSAEIQNLNTKFAVQSFDYEINFYDKPLDVAGKKLLQSIKRKSFIYAGEIKNIIEAGVKITTGIPASAEIKIDANNIVWKDKKDFFPPLNVEIKDISAALEDNQVKVSGYVANENNFSISRVVINAFLIDKMGVKIGVSKTELQNIGPFMRENFEIPILITKTLQEQIDIKATQIFSEILK